MLCIVLVSTEDTMMVLVCDLVSVTTECGRTESKMTRAEEPTNGDASKPVDCRGCKVFSLVGARLRELTLNID